MITVNVPEVSIGSVIGDITDMACFCIEQGRPLSLRYASNQRAHFESPV